MIGDDRLKKANDLLLSGGHDVELPSHLGEAIVDMRTQAAEVLPKVDEVLAKGSETRGGGMAELADVAVGGSGEYTSGRGILLGCLHPPSEIAHLLFESADA